MTNDNNYSDLAFVTAFQQCRLLPEQFSHEAHLRLAWLYLAHLGLDNAIQFIQKDLKKYVAHWGASDKYNTTLTIASVRAVYYFMGKSESKTFNAFITEFPKLKYQFKELLGCHYVSDIFNCEVAKVKYLEPELLPFD
ncbi:hypothetical protein PP182_07655 [Maribacter sp. PR1]|uniref:Uncharacterized protein n=1 Tax=Maribacter cobaltidurans TaxID=1178778 RepID=A0ABU7ISJ3_9FLAO|nr:MULTISPECIES: hypothetical protein [Maribacter]MDC6388553.1 hypothetical protein [Maribacter sp. PR1]MEE1975942.1 hypothetical protein [Maribacter cobaltidurans]